MNKQLKVLVEALFSEKMESEARQYLLIELVINLSAIQTLTDQCPQSLPRDFLRVHVLSVLAHLVQPFITRIQCHSQIGFIKLVDLCPPNWGKAQSLSDLCMEPRKHKMKTRALSGRAVTSF